MNIDITNEDYRLLLDMSHIADWVLNAFKITGEDPDTKKYEAIMQKFYPFAEEMGASNLVVWDENSKKYHTTREHEASVAEAGYIDEYDEDVFWNELIHRLALRDLCRQEGEEVVKNMKPTELDEKEAPLVEKYQKEFRQNGLENVSVG